MTRGRKKDLSIPPSRALTQQRDYRARKAQYLSELEERCHRAEQENVALRKELDTLRAGLPLSCPLDPRLVSASSELMKDLNAATHAIQEFQKLAFPEVPALSLDSPAQSSSALPQASSVACLRPAFFPSPSPSISEPSLPPCDTDRPRESPDRWPVESSRAPESLRKILCFPDVPDSRSRNARGPERLPSFIEDDAQSDMSTDTS